MSSLVQAKCTSSVRCCRSKFGSWFFRKYSMALTSCEVCCSSFFSSFMVFSLNWVTSLRSWVFVVLFSLFSFGSAWWLVRWMNHSISISSLLRFRAASDRCSTRGRTVFLYRPSIGLRGRWGVIWCSCVWLFMFSFRVFCFWKCLVGWKLCL